jgi:hypothetical protein
MKRTLVYAAVTKEEAQRSIQPFYEVVILFIHDFAYERKKY